MCLRALVLVTQALIWTSSLSVWSATAHPLLHATQTSSIAPRARKSGPCVSQIDPQSIWGNQQHYKANPSLRTNVVFTGKDHATFLVPVQAWKGVPGSLANVLISLPTRNDDFPIVITGYFDHNKNSIDPIDMDSPGVDQRAELHVAALQPQGWDEGTAVWEHILALKPERKVILEIAMANKELSLMLYEEVDQTQKPGFRLFSLGEKPTVIEGRDGLKKVIRLPASVPH